MENNNYQDKPERDLLNDIGENEKITDTNNTGDKPAGKRIPIKRRVRVSALTVVILASIAVASLSFATMLSIRKKTEEVLVTELISDMRNQVRESAEDTHLKLKLYESMLVFVTDYISEMYEGRETVIGIGSHIDPPLSTTPEGVYALQCSYANKDLIDDPDVVEDMYFFSGLEKIYSPIARENEDILVTMYTVTDNGFMVAYDKDSYVAANPDNSEIIYDYFDSEWYQKGIAAKGVVYTGLYEDIYGRGLVITLASPFNDENGNVCGVSCIDFNITELYDRMISENLTPGGKSFAIDPEGRIITPDSIGLTVEEYTGLSREEADSLTEGVDGILETDDAFYVYMPVEGMNWTLCSYVPKDDILGNVRDIDRTISYSILVFILTVIAIIIIVVVVSNKLVDRMTNPINRLFRDMDIISAGNLDHKAIRVRNDEIGDIADNLNKMVGKLKSTISDLDLVNRKVNALSDTATKDPLTGIRNKAAYDQVLFSLEEDYEKGLKKFGFARIDLNDLKVINDTYGKEKGNEAIKKLCYIVCHVFEHSPVFRADGDEFVVILRGEDYANIEALCLEFHGKIVSLSDDDSLDPWEKISAAIGYALYEELDDRNVDDVYRRAGSELAECKERMKLQKK